MAFGNAEKQRNRKGSRKERRAHAIKDIREELLLGIPNNLIIEAIREDHSYCLSSIYLLIKEARIQLAIREKSNRIGVNI